MTTLREAAKAALWAFELHVQMTWPTDRSTAAIATLRAALAQEKAEPVSADMQSAVRWAPSSAYWSQRLREFFGPDAREGIDALERRLAEMEQVDLSRCPKCGGPADNGHDRSIPPNTYLCTKCMAEPVAEIIESEIKEDSHQPLDDAMHLPRAMAQAYESGYKAGVANEREACAKVCESRFMGDLTREDMEARRCAAAIRARREMP